MKLMSGILTLFTQFDNLQRGIISIRMNKKEPLAPFSPFADFDCFEGLFCVGNSPVSVVNGDAVNSIADCCCDWAADG